jgi:hypothetical protein
MTTPPVKSDKSVKRVMISSTARDLSTHRNVVKEACLRQGMLPDDEYHVGDQTLEDLLREINAYEG